MAWREGLSEQQAEVAAMTDSVVRLVAGPGTGKTRVMTQRVAFLIEEQSVPPDRILALTFSRAAARELRQRLDLLLGEDIGDRPAVSTLHSFALRQLLKNKGAPNLPHPILIADDYDERHVIEEDIRWLSGAPSIKSVQKELQNLASDWQTLAADEDEWENVHPNPKFLGAWRRHREIYGYTLRAELVYSLKRALENDSDYPLERDFAHVVVDEYQDLNKCEIDVVRRLIDGDRALFAAGDDDQSIYGFRNAYPVGLRRFSDSYPEGQSEEELEECYRCDKSIVRVARRVIEQDVDRIEKEWDALGEAEEGSVSAYRFYSISGEARGIATLAKGLIDDGVAPEDILVLLRNDPQGVYSTPLIDALAAEGVEAELAQDPYGVLDEDEPRLLVCILRLLENPRDSLAWRELIAVRRNGIGTVTLRAIYDLANDLGWTYAETLARIADDPTVFKNSRSKTVAAEVGLVQQLLEELKAREDEQAAQVLPDIIDVLELDIHREDVATAVDVLTVLAERDELSLAELQGAVQSVKGAYSEVETERTGIQIMSMHSAKGLTAAAVFIPACEEELIPGRAETRREIDDERRLLYVSLTRAQHHLILTFSTKRTGRQSQILQVSEDRTFTSFLQGFVSPTDF